MYCILQVICFDVIRLYHHYTLGSPAVFNPPVDFFAVEGDDAYFDCGTYATPFPTTEWSFQGSTLQPGMKYSIAQSGPNIGRLTIRNVTYDDQGIYTCNASNTINSLTISAQLFIQGVQKLCMLQILYWDR